MTLQNRTRERYLMYGWPNYDFNPQPGQGIVSPSTDEDTGSSNDQPLRSTRRNKVAQ